MAFGDSIKAYLGLDTAGFKAGLKSAHSDVIGFGKAVAGALSISVSVAGIEQGLRAIIEYATRVQDLSDRYNVNAAALQRLGNAAELNGSSLEGVAKGFNKLEIAQSRALRGNDKMIEAFGHLGVNVAELKSLSPEEIMLKLGKSSLNAADLVDVLGKSALELRPTLAGIADGTIAYGNALDAIDIEKLKRADDLWKRLWQNIKRYGAEGVVTSVDAVQVAVANLNSAFKSMGYAGVSALKAVDAASHFDLKGIIAEMDKLFKTNIELSGSPKEDEKKKRKFGPSETPKKDDERIQFSLKELAEKSPLMSNVNDKEFANNIQAVWATREAQQVQTLEGQSKRQALLQDPAGAKRSLDLADTMRQGISGLKEGDKDVGMFSRAIDSSATGGHIASMDAALNQDE